MSWNDRLWRHCLAEFDVVPYLCYVLHGLYSSFLISFCFSFILLRLGAPAICTWSICTLTLFVPNAYLTFTIKMPCTYFSIVHVNESRRKRTRIMELDLNVCIITLRYWYLLIGQDQRQLYLVMAGERDGWWKKQTTHTINSTVPDQLYFIGSIQVHSLQTYFAVPCTPINLEEKTHPRQIGSLDIWLLLTNTVLQCFWFSVFMPTIK